MVWIIVILVMVVILLVVLYRRAITQEQLLINYIWLVLMDQECWRVQRRGLHRLVQSVDVPNAVDLGARVNIAFVKFAQSFSDTRLGTVGMLWEFKQRPLHE